MQLGHHCSNAGVLVMSRGASRFANVLLVFNRCGADYAVGNAADAFMHVGHAVSTALISGVDGELCGCNVSLSFGAMARNYTWPLGDGGLRCVSSRPNRSVRLHLYV